MLVKGGQLRNHTVFISSSTYRLTNEYRPFEMFMSFTELLYTNTQNMVMVGISLRTSPHTMNI